VAPFRGCVAAAREDAAHPEGITRTAAEALIRLGGALDLARRLARRRGAVNDLERDSGHGVTTSLSWHADGMDGQRIERILGYGQITVPARAIDPAEVELIRPRLNPGDSAVSSWEDRMSARAQERIRAEEERLRAIDDAEWAAEEAALEERYRPVREAGPPGGCRECYAWCRHGDHMFWAHGESRQPGRPPDGLEPGSYLLDSPEEWWCWHPCHGGKPAYCAQAGYA
jgi:hypothetical protein